MKKFFLILFLSILILGFRENILQAATIYTFIPPVPDLYDLDHYKAYSWGIRHNLLPNEIITHARMQFRNINDWIIEDNDRLYVRLFPNAPEGIGIFTDDQAPGDFFAGIGRRLFIFTDDNEYWNGQAWVNPPENFTYYFSNPEIYRLNQVIQDGNFGFGFDPDCHYWNDGIRFQFRTEVIPEPATISLLGLGLLGLIRFRKIKNRA